MISFIPMNIVRCGNIPSNQIIEGVVHGLFASVCGLIQDWI